MLEKNGLSLQRHEFPLPLTHTPLLLHGRGEGLGRKAQLTLIVASMYYTTQKHNPKARESYGKYRFINVFFTCRVNAVTSNNSSIIHCIKKSFRKQFTRFESGHLEHETDFLFTRGDPCMQQLDIKLMCLIK
jgi:hypothetical protein